MDHGSAGKSGKWACEVCRGEHRSRRAAAKGAAAPDFSHAAAAHTAEPDLVFDDVAAPVNHLELKPWKASMWTGAVAVAATTMFAVIWRGVPWPFLLVAGLGVVWASIGLFGKYVEKGMAAMGVGLNLLPFVIAAMVGVRGIDMRAPDADKAPFESMNPEEKLQFRKNKQLEFMNRLQSDRSRGRRPGMPAPQPEAQQQEQ